MKDLADQDQTSTDDWRTRGVNPEWRETVLRIHWALDAMGRSTELLQDALEDGFDAVRTLRFSTCDLARQMWKLRKAGVRSVYNSKRWH